MSSLSHYLPAAPSPRLSAPRTFPTRPEPLGWSLAVMLLGSIAMTALNRTWLTTLSQFFFFFATGLVAMLLPASSAPRRRAPLLIAAALPIWGAVQMFTGHAAYNYAALLSILYWTQVPAGLLLGALLLRDHARRDAFLSSLWSLAVIITLLELYQLLVLGRWTTLPSGLPLMSSNLYAELAELLLPAILATALRRGSRLWLGCGLTASLVATTVAAGARTGSVLLLVEIAAVILVTRQATGYRKLSWRRHGILFALTLLASLAIEGTSYLGERFQQHQFFEGRSEIVASALNMVRQHPLTGFGFGAFAVVYPQFDHLGAESFVNHVHNDYLELTVDGGAPLLLLWLLLVAVCLPAVVKTPWAFGTIAILVHSTTDFPLYRMPVLVLFVLLFAAAHTRVSSFKTNVPSNKKQASLDFAGQGRLRPARHA